MQYVHLLSEVLTILLFHLWNEIIIKTLHRLAGFFYFSYPVMNDVISK